MTRATLLLDILQSYVENPRERYKISRMYNDVKTNFMAKIKDSQEIETSMEKFLINTIAEGVNNGNWPWDNEQNEA